MKNKILIFTGAGVSAESGVETFRGDTGLWCNYKIEEVASIDGWEKDRKKVLDFYNERRSEMKKVSPNLAHFLIAELEIDFDVTVITQNVDCLHERAGSTKVIHLHGELNKAQSSIDPSIVLDWEGDINIGDKCPKGSQIRPKITWFGENLDINSLEDAKSSASQSDVCVIVGTSMQVAPANTIPFLTKESSLIYYVDPDSINFHIPKYRRPFFYHFRDKASIGMQKVYDDLIKIF